MTTSKELQDVRRGVRSSPALREHAACGVAPFQPPASPSLSVIACESCERVPAAVWLYGFAVCGGCANAGLNP